MSALTSYRTHFSRSLAALLRRARGPSAKNGWARAIEQVAGDLENLNRSTERDFLAVGEKLAEFRSAARRISSDMAVLTELISGGHGHNASHALDRILEHSRTMHAGMEDSGQALATVRDQAGRLRQAFCGLPNTVSVFRTLCTLTRIETARLGNTSDGFGDLAEEVRPLSESIQASGEGVLEAASQLDRAVQSAILRASGLLAKELRELPPLIATVTDNLQSFVERQQRAREASVRQAAQYEALCAAIDGLVTNVQFHDITRQQVNHVAEVLRQLRPGDGPDARPVLILQSSQLHSAGGVFASAIEGIERDLDSIAARLQGMAETGRALMGVSTQDHTSFFRRMEGCFTTILQAVAACDQAQAEIRSTAGDIAQRVERMRASIAEIRGIEIRIQRIAINATIRAAHIGPGGDPLSVIADGMQRLVSVSGGNTEDAAHALDAIGDAARQLLGGGDAQSGAGEASRHMRQAILEMHSASELGFSRVNQIADLGAGLAAAIVALRGGFSAGSLFAEVVQQSCAALDRVAAELPADDAAQDLAKLAENYTMQTERDVHQQVLQGEFADQPLGENVELF
jgi:hypothetical protein